MDSVLDQLARVLAERRAADPQVSYVASLHARGLDAILKKVGEEATETVIAAKGTDPAAVIRETADLWFHVMVMLSHLGLDHTAVLEELARRAGRSGLAEKAARGANPGAAAASNQGSGPLRADRAPTGPTGGHQQPSSMETES